MPPIFQKPMTQRSLMTPSSKKLSCFTLLAVLLPFVLASCVSAAKKESSASGKSVKAPVSSETPRVPPSPDVVADTTLGAIPAEGPSEAEQQADELESEDQAEKALREISRREKEEEARRLQRSITE